MLKIDESDSVWSSLREEVVRMADSETMLASYLHAAVLNHRCLLKMRFRTSWPENSHHHTYQPCLSGK